MSVAAPVSRRRRPYCRSRRRGPERAWRRVGLWQLYVRRPCLRSARHPPLLSRTVGSPAVAIVLAEHAEHGLDVVGLFLDAPL